MKDASFGFFWYWLSEERLFIMTILVIYGFVVAGILGLAVVAYLFSVNSRRYYVCPECGERMRMEHGAAQRCNVCGTPFKEA